MAASGKGSGSPVEMGVNACPPPTHPGSLGASPWMQAPGTLRREALGGDGGQEPGSLERTEESSREVRSLPSWPQQAPNRDHTCI